MGMQAMGVVDNDDYNCLIHVRDKGMHKKDLEGNCFHPIRIERNSVLYRIIEEEEHIVNSIHTMVLPYLNKAKAIAFSSNGEIEALEFYAKRFAVGVQWHPELMLNDKKMENLFKEFIKETIK